MKQQRDFMTWLDQFQPVISNYSFYTDFAKAARNTQALQYELALLNTLLRTTSVEDAFIKLYSEYPEVLNAIPILLAVRSAEVPVYVDGKIHNYTFNKPAENLNIHDYMDFMRETGLFDLMRSGQIKDFNDYVFGVEVGLDSNGRKNRGGHLMEDLVEHYLVRCGLTRCEHDGKKPLTGDPTESQVYYKELYSSQCQDYWGIDLSSITNKGTVEKRFDFVVKTADQLFGIETNFYSGNGSKLNEVARSYKELAEESILTPGFTFVWVTDGRGWRGARNNLQETFEVMEHIYNLYELENGAFEKLFGTAEKS